MFRAFFRCVTWIGFVYLSLIIVENSWPIVLTEDAVPFLEERIELSEASLWRAMLALHVAAGIASLLASFLQFFRPLLDRLPWLHRWLGRVYTWSILGVLAPSGFYLAIYAKGGLAGIAGFVVLGIFTTHSTWMGWISIRRGRKRSHVTWMIRSFAMVTTAITFRIYNLGLAQMGVPLETVYILALYLSLVGNALAAEWLIARLDLPISTETQRNTNHEKHPHPVAAFSESLAQGLRPEN
ncbi:MAG: DUF2306 domain-containing protein [Limisphaerales bacterium]